MNKLWEIKILSFLITLLSFGVYAQDSNIDKLNDKGVQFTESYVTNSEGYSSLLNEYYKSEPIYSEEAENADLSGTAEIIDDCSNASNSAFVKLSNVQGNSLTFNGIDIQEAGLYRLTTDYFFVGNSRIELFVNEQYIGQFDFESANWCYQGSASQFSIGIYLDVGLNNIKFVVVDIAGPFIDKISLAKEEPIDVNFITTNVRLLEGQSTELTITANKPFITNESLELNLTDLDPSKITVTPQIINFNIGDKNARITVTSLTDTLFGTIELTSSSSNIHIGESRIATINVITTPALFYVSNEGNDSNNGISETTPWKSLQYVSKSKFIPGDSIFFRKGDVFTGHLTINSSGTTSTPIVFSSYGSGDKPIIDGANIDGGAFREAILIENQQFIELKDLKITNDRRVSKEGVSDDVSYGITIINSSDEILEYFRLTNLNIAEIYPVAIPEEADFDNMKIAGVFVQSDRNTEIGTEKYIKNLVMEDCFVTRTGKFGFWSKHAGGDEGVGNEQLNRNNDFIFRNNHFFETGGSGIQPGGTYNCLVENNIFEYTGYSNDNEPRLAGRGSGAWFWSCRNVVSQFNKSLHIRGPKDSYGQHIDFGNKYVLLQYNYSEDSEGGFVEILGDNEYCTYRYNISVNDGLRNTEGNTLWVSTWSTNNIPSNNSYIYNNSIYVGGDITPDIDIEAANTYVYNNIFYVTDNAKIGEIYSVENTGGGVLTMDNNLFFGNVNSALSDLDEASIFANPRYHQPGILNAEGYKLEEGSPAINTARDFTEPLFPHAGIGIFKYITANATQDYFGNPVDLNSSPHIGAFNGTTLPTTKPIVNISLSQNELYAGEELEIIAQLDRHVLSDQTVNFEITGIPQDLYTLSANEISVLQDKKQASILLSAYADNQNTDDVIGNISFTEVSDGLDLGTTLTSDITFLKIDNASTFEFESQAFSIYPNPVMNYLKIDDESSSILYIDILNLNGNIVQTKKPVNDVLDISNLTDGVYFLRIVTYNQKVFLKKIVKN